MARASEPRREERRVQMTRGRASADRRGGSATGHRPPVSSTYALLGYALGVATREAIDFAVFPYWHILRFGWRRYRRYRERARARCRAIS